MKLHRLVSKSELNVSSKTCHCFIVFFNNASDAYRHPFHCSLVMKHFDTFFENNEREMVSHLPRTIVLFWNEQLEKVHFAQDYERMKSRTQDMLNTSFVKVNDISPHGQDPELTLRNDATQALDTELSLQDDAAQGHWIQGYRPIRSNSTSTATLPTGSSVQSTFSVSDEQTCDTMRRCLESMVALLRQPPILNQEDFIDFVKGMREQLQSKYMKQSYLMEEIQSLQIQLASMQPPAADDDDGSTYSI